VDFEGKLMDIRQQLTTIKKAQNWHNSDDIENWINQRKMNKLERPLEPGGKTAKGANSPPHFLF
jgi:hypothetical protein